MNRERLLEQLRFKSINEMAIAAKKRRETEPFNGGSGSAASASSFSGFAIDGPLVGATVYAVAEDQYTITDSEGRFTFPFQPSGEIRVQGGVDSITGLDFTGVLRSTPGSVVISPITTAIREIMDQGFTETQATASFFQFGENVLGIPVDTAVRERVKSVNFVAKAAEGDQALVKAQALATALETAAETAASAAEQVDQGLTLTQAKQEYYKKIGSITKQRSGGFEVNESVKTQILESLSRLSDSLTSNEYQAIKEETLTAIEKIKNVVLEDGINANYAVTATQAFSKLYKQELATKVRQAVGKSLTKTQAKAIIDTATTVAKLSATTPTLGRISTQVSNITSDQFQWPTAIGFQVTQNEQPQNIILNYDATEFNYKPTYKGNWIDESVYYTWWNNSLDRWEAGSTLGTALLTGPTTQDSPLGSWTYIDSDDQVKWGTLNITQTAPGDSDPVPPPPAQAPPLIITLTQPQTWLISTQDGRLVTNAGGTLTLTQGKSTEQVTISQSKGPIKTLTGTVGFTFASKTQITATLSITLDGTLSSYQATLLPNGKAAQLVES